MTHFRGLLQQTVSENGIAGYWAPLCSTKALPKTGDVTTDAHKVTCPECRKILRLPKLEEPEPHWSDR